MKYSKARSLIKTGDVIATSGYTWHGRLVQLVTREDVSHVGFAAWLGFNGGDKRLCLFDSQVGRGVGFEPISHCLMRGEHVYWYQLIDGNIKGPELLDFCIQHWGENYANIYQFIIFISPTLKFLRTFLGKDLDTSDDRWHCSELITSAFLAQGYAHDKEPVLTTPGDVTRFTCLYTRVELEND